MNSNLKEDNKWFKYDYFLFYNICLIIAKSYFLNKNYFMYLIF